LMSHTQTFLPFIHITHPRWGQTTIPPQDKKSEFKHPTPTPSHTTLSTQTIKRNTGDSSDDFVKLSSSQRWNTPIVNVKKNSQPLLTNTLDIPTSSPNKSPEVTQPPLAQTINIEEELTTQNLYKTELCRSFEETGVCRYGPKCRFAHGRAELRPILRHPKYKTEVCKTFQCLGTCPYGKRCRFIHIPASQRPAEKEISLESTRNFSDVSKKAQVNTSLPQPSLPPLVSLPRVSALPVPPISALSVPAHTKFFPPLSPLTSTFELGPEEEEEENSSDVFNSDNETDLSRLEGLIDSMNLNWEETEEQESEETFSKKDSERRLSIFQRICSEQAISV